jgi:membrane associated rhomboid family serine protease
MAQYVTNGNRISRLTMFTNLTPTVRALLILNIGMYAAQVFLGPDQFAPLELWPLHSDPANGGLPFEPWQLISYAFLHGGFWHLFANMFALYMFGPDIERLLGASRFRLYYLVCVLGSAGAQLWVTATVYPSPYPTLGASGGIFGLLLCYGMAYPHRQLLLVFPPIPMPAWVFVTLYGVLELFLGVFGTNQGVAHFAHLGGMAAGFVLIQYWRARSARR